MALILAAWSFLPAGLAAQPVLPAPALNLDGLAPLEEVDLLELPAISVVLSRSIAELDVGGPWRYAEPFAVENGDPYSLGRWETVNDGRTAVWRLRVASAGAVSLDFGFTRYVMPRGGWLRIHAPGETDSIRPFTSADNEDHGQLWTPVIEGGEAVIEVVVPAARKGELELELGAVNRGFRDLARVRSPNHESCHIDTVCSQADPYRDQVASVGLITYGGGSCSGVLLNNTAKDRKPYFLTARHCRVPPPGYVGAVAEPASAVVYWGYESPTCGGREGSQGSFQTGAYLRASSAESDFDLLELDDALDPSHDLYLAGWDSRGDAPTSSAGIHHPRGHVKSIALDGDRADIGYFLGAEALRVAWDVGRTEGGSSGSPLFDQNGRVAGQLIGGDSTCDPSGFSNYGRFSVSWDEGGLSRWLDPEGTGDPLIDGGRLNGPPEVVDILHDKALRASDGTAAGSLDVDVGYAFRDPYGDDLSYGASSSDPSRVTVAVSGSTVTISPVAAGTATITVTATDDYDPTVAEATFEVVVADNRSPEAAGALAALSLRVSDGDVTVDLAPAFQDADLDALTYGASSSDEEVVSVAVSGSILTVTPLVGRSAAVTVTATDESGSDTTVRQSFHVAVENQPPVAVGTMSSLVLLPEAGWFPVNVEGAFEDPDGDPLTYRASSSDGFLGLRVAGSIVEIGPGPFRVSVVTVTADDGRSAPASQSFTVTRSNSPPAASGSAHVFSLRMGEGAGTEDLSLLFWDRDPLTYAVDSGEPYASLFLSDSTLTLTPLAPGMKDVLVSARDPGGSNVVTTLVVNLLVRPALEAAAAPDALWIVEGASGGYRVSLNAIPRGRVVVTPSVVGSGGISVSPSSLTLDNTNWASGVAVTVRAAQDGDAEANAPIEIRHDVSGPGQASVAAPSVTVTVVEDDAPTLFVAPARAVEGTGSLRFQVTLSASSPSEVSVDYATVDGSGSAGARAGSDYAETSGRLTFAAGAASTREILVPVIDDDGDEEEEERFGLILRNAVNAALQGGGSFLEAEGAIEDDDFAAVRVSFESSGFVLAEGEAATVVVRAEPAPEEGFQVELLHGFGEGASKYDYSGAPSRLSFARGVTSVEFPLAVRNDHYREGDEVAVLSLKPLASWVRGGGSTTITMLDAAGGGGSGGPPPGDPGGGDGGGGGGPPPGDPGGGDGRGGSGGTPPGDPGGGDGGGGSGGTPPGDSDGGGGNGGGGSGGPPRASIGTDADCAGAFCRARTGARVSFRDASVGTVRTRRWDFGDGGRPRGASVSHSWSEPGFYEVTLWTSDGSVESTASLTFLVEASDPAGGCVANAETLCLQDSRYAVTVDWWREGGGYADHDHGVVVHAGTNDSGLFRFFGEDNWEVLIKVLDGCARNGHAWVFGASTTDLGYLIRVRDTVTGAVREYRNEPGVQAPAITDAKAFPASCAR